MEELWPGTNNLIYLKQLACLEKVSSCSTIEPQVSFVYPPASLTLPSQPRCSWRILPSVESFPEQRGPAEITSLVPLPPLTPSRSLLRSLPGVCSQSATAAGNCRRARCGLVDQLTGSVCRQQEHHAIGSNWEFLRSESAAVGVGRAARTGNCSGAY